MQQAFANPVLPIATPPTQTSLAPAPAHPHLPTNKQALDFAQAGRYHALRSNCIAFADYACRVLTGGAVRGAPLIFDLLVGQVNFCS